MQQLASELDYALADGGIRKTVAEWLKLGIQFAPGASMPANVGQLSAALLLPAGYRGPASLVLDNFRAILKEPGQLIVLRAGRGPAVGTVCGGGVIRGDWPKDEPPLSRSQRIDLQMGVERQCDAGNLTELSARTRARRSGRRSTVTGHDGYPTVKLLESLQEPLDSFMATTTIGGKPSIAV